MKVVFSLNSRRVICIMETSCSRSRWMLVLMFRNRALVKAFAPFIEICPAEKDRINRAVSIIAEKISVIFTLNFMGGPSCMKM